jgi:hypothetical protein
MADGKRGAVMISRQRWDDLSDDEKWNYLFRHCSATEQNLEKLGASVQRLAERLKRLDAGIKESAS